MLKKILLILGIVIILTCIITFISIKNIYNGFVAGSEEVKSKWSQVENVYQRRLDLIPNLVETVKGYANHEKETLTGVIEARSKVNNINISKDILNNPNAFKQFSQANAGLSSALSKLMVVVEKYPDLKANQNFMNLQSQLEGTENRISVERRRYNEAAKAFNISIKKFPNVLLAGIFNFKEFVYFKSETGAEKAPKVKF
jgi:LemA protein